MPLRPAMLSSPKFLFFLAFASLSAAQQLTLTPQCTSTLINTFSNPDVVQCLTPSPLLGILSTGNNSVIPPINNWLGSLCPAPACSNATIGAVVSNLTSGCPTEAAVLGVKTDDVPALTTLVEQFYPIFRQAFCLKDGDTNCVTQTLTNIQTITGPLTITRALQIITGGFSNLNIPPNVTCTNCIKAWYNLINDRDSTFFSAAALKETCGAVFVDGNNPPGIVQTASGANGGNIGGGGHSGSVVLTFNGGSGVTALLLTFAGFALLA